MSLKYGVSLAPRIHHVCIRRKVVSDSCPSGFTTPATYWTEGLADHSAGSKPVAENKTLWPCRESNPGRRVRGHATKQSYRNNVIFSITDGGLCLKRSDERFPPLKIW